MISVLEADRARLSYLEAQIILLEMSLSALRSEKMEVQERLDSYKYPVLTLPSEMVSEIFVAFLPEYPRCPPLRGALSPTLLTQICREWREIALATPSLWRAIRLFLPDRDRKASTRQFEMSDVWLARSRCSPLSFRLHENGMHVETFRTLAPHCARVEYLDLRLYRSRSSIEGPMPLLRHLKIHLDDTPGRDVFICHEAPLLRTAILIDRASAHVVLPWSQLTSLTLKGEFPEECDTVLRWTPNLVHCELWFAYDAENGGTFPELPLLQLESLTINHWEDDEPTTGFLGVFIAPALRFLRISEESLGPDPIDTMRAFISKSGCRLQELDITGQISVHKDVAEYRRAFPAIPKLSLHGWYASGEESDEEEVSESDNLEIEDT
ncbi:hypothetical protein DFH06DRAFT_1364834 [Mycena polygramma]|nr:hypothetical protein DFH06DRAFT_1364834 [Mycena polygramma]